MGSDFLFAMPSFCSGAARTLDLGGTFDAYNDSPSTQEADRRALASDWTTVGRDLQNAMTEFDGQKASQSSRPAQSPQGR